ncbi:FAD-dependent oxidoreductase [Mesorhizobium sp. 8]|uniref:NAD(P)/FAD-dependent oxidoreductase n=1 Tax=Mesorhizobium sp. 8 TaxID=2584466 RepID=UPI00111D71F1|nr:FAD-dependent oxidoreductase [Mesorhizobium sp. 8]QDC00805.1 FAD-binding oxidoreductase [Mesorhizobium sp. 8]
MTGISLWQAVARGRRDRPALDESANADLAIVGGGFSGLSSALHAAAKGLSVVVLEAETVAWGASGRNAGFVVPNFAKRDPDDIVAELGRERGERLVDFAAASGDLVFELIRRHAIACAADRSGWVQPAHTEAAFAKVKARAAQWAKRGRPVEVLDAQQVEALTGAGGYAGGWIDRSGGVLDPVAYALGLADAVEAAGARIFERTRVTAIRRDAGGYRLATAKGEVRAAKVFVATNAYGGPLFPQLARSYFPLRVFQIATRPLPMAARLRLLPGNQCVSDTRRNLFTFRFDADNRLISGGMHIFSPGAAERVPRAIHRRLAEKLDLPDIPPIEHAWSGLAAVAPDFLPHLVDLGPGMIAGFACNGRGIAMTTAMGAAVADWAAGADPEALPIPYAAPRAIPLHGLLRHAPNALLPWSMLCDRLDETGAG